MKRTLYNGIESGMHLPFVRFTYGCEQFIPEISPQPTRTVTAFDGIRSAQVNVGNDMDFRDFPKFSVFVACEVAL